MSDRWRIPFQQKEIETMMPNKFVVIWNGYPVYWGNAPRKIMSREPQLVSYWDTKGAAQECVDYFLANWPEMYAGMEVKEIQFRIVG